MSLLKLLSADLKMKLTVGCKTEAAIKRYQSAFSLKCPQFEMSIKKIEKKTQLKGTAEIWRNMNTFRSAGQEGKADCPVIADELQEG